MFANQLLIMDTKEEEIPLAEILLSIYAFFYKKFKLIALFTFLGGVLGLTFYLTRPKVYKSTSTIYSSVVSNQRLVDILNQLDILRKSSDNELLAETLNIDSSLATSIKSISASLVIDLEYLYDKDHNPRYESNCVSITFETINTELFEILDSSVLFYLSNSPFLNQKVNSRANMYQKIITKSNEELNELDSIQKLKMSLLDNKSNIGGFQEISGIKSGESEIMLLFVQKERTTNLLNELAAANIVRPFNIAPEKVSVFYKPILGLGFAFMIIGIFIGIIQHFNAKVKSYLKD